MVAAVALPLSALTAPKKETLSGSRSASWAAWRVLRGGRRSGHRARQSLSELPAVFSLLGRRPQALQTCVRLHLQNAVKRFLRGPHVHESGELLHVVPVTFRHSALRDYQVQCLTGVGH
jgi:hypothetical protein